MNNVLFSDVHDLFTRDFERLHREIAAYENEANLWAKTDMIANSAGNLTLHICGNTRHFIGHVLGKIGYQRNRTAEFNTEGLSRSALFEEIAQALKEVQFTLSKLDDKLISQTYPLEVFGDPIRTGQFIVHLHGHFNYHLGLINYHRRLLDS
jgi:hypothetical protein